MIHAITARTAVRHLTASIALATLAASTSAWSAEKHKVSGTATFVSMAARTSGYGADKPKRDLAQWTAIWSFASSAPDFDGMIETAPTQSIDGPGIGRHQGFFTFRHRNGDESHGYFHGTHEVVSKPDGSWDMNIDGVKVITGGTGRFANAKGTLRYSARNTPYGAQFGYSGDIEY
jgi:hypothetical protein